jgi:hypothetical protein
VLYTTCSEKGELNIQYKFHCALGTPYLIFGAAENQGLSDMLSGTIGDASKLLKIQT